MCDGPGTILNRYTRLRIRLWKKWSNFTRKLLLDEVAEGQSLFIIYYDTYFFDQN
jgi:hypothetical protein